MATTWTDERVKLLTHLWEEVGLTATQIGQRIGLNKNQVIGKVHRLKLKSRASPIMERLWTQERIATVKKLKARDMGSGDIGKAMGLEPRSVYDQVTRLNRQRRESLAKIYPQKKHSPNANSGAAWRCQFPMTGDTLDHRKPTDWTGHNDSWKCGERCKPGSPYCAEHHAVCYIKPPARPERDTRAWHANRVMR